MNYVLKYEWCSDMWMMYNCLIYMCVCVIIHVFVYHLVNVYRKKFTLIFIIKLMELSLKIEMSHFRVSDIVVTRWVVTSGDDFEFKHGFLQITTDLMKLPTRIPWSIWRNSWGWLTLSFNHKLPMSIFGWKNDV